MDQQQLTIWFARFYEGDKFKCNICDKKYKSKDSLIRYIKATY